MRSTLQSEPAASARAGGSQRGRHRRRRLIVDAGAQLRASASTVTVVAVLLALLNVALYEMSRLMTESLSEVAPELAATLVAGDRVRLAVSVACSLVLVLGFAALRLAESTRTFGAAHRIAARLRAMAAGRAAPPLRLRRHDTLHELAAAVNELAETLERRARGELDALERLAGLAEGPEGPAGAAGEITRGLRGLIESRRRRDA